MVTDSSVNLSWARSPSEDLAYQLLLRRASEKDQAWTVLDTVGKKIEFYVDRMVEQNVMYQYQLIAVDSSGLRSPACSPVQGRPYDRRMRPAVQNLSARYDSISKSVILKWSYISSHPEEFWFTVYRSVEGRSLAQYRAVKSEIPEFRDSDVGMQPPYKYAIKVITKSGAESLLSNTVTVNK
jgi:fibronectin type 3 domain-containing protein